MGNLKLWTAGLNNIYELSLKKNHNRGSLYFAGQSSVITPAITVVWRWHHSKHCMGVFHLLSQFTLRALLQSKLSMMRWRSEMLSCAPWRKICAKLSIEWHKRLMPIGVNSRRSRACPPSTIPTDIFSSTSIPEVSKEVLQAIYNIRTCGTSRIQAEPTVRLQNLSCLPYFNAQTL